jgi:engulfment and cell motility protein 1
VALAVTQPLINIVRNALTLLVLVVSRPLESQSSDGGVSTFGFRAIKPALDNHPTFLESLVQRLSASDHTLCANALQLLNALMRDAITNGGEHEWPKFIKRLQELGVIGGVGMLMRGDAAADAGSPLAAAILEFQGLTKVLLRKWKEVRVNVEMHEHKKALKTIHLLSNPEPYHAPTSTDTTNGATTNGSKKGARKHHPEKWRRLGFETESPAWEFDETGYLGMMDLVDFAKRNEDIYQKTLMEQSVQPKQARCPVARASLSVTLILYEHFEIDESAYDEGGAGRRNSLQERVLEARANGNLDRLYRPLLLQWGKLHTAAVLAFLRLWKASGAEVDDFYKIEEVVRIVVERIVGQTTRKTDVGTVEEGLRSATLKEARKWQMEGLDEVYEDAWGPHLQQVREQLEHESVVFMKEQRVRCLLQGSWFPTGTSPNEGGWRFVRLSHNRRWLHYENYPDKGEDDIPLEDLTERVDLNSVTSVDSNVSASEPHPAEDGIVNSSHNSSTETLTTTSKPERHRSAPTSTKITIIGTPPASKTYKLTPLTTQPVETILLELHPTTSALASEWLDGLLMLLNQQPITKDTTRLVDMMEDWGVRLRMLNLRWEDVDWEALEWNVKAGAGGEKVEVREVPSRDGLDEDYWYALPET